VLYYITYLKGKLGRKNKPAHSEDAGA